MPVSKLKIKLNEPAAYIYGGAFLVYFAILVLVFVYSINFLADTINEAFAPAQSVDLNQSYTQLDLNSYAVLVNKLNLEKRGILLNQINPNLTTDSVATDSLATSSNTDMLRTSAGDEAGTSTRITEVINLPGASLNGTIKEIIPTSSTSPAVEEPATPPAAPAYDQKLIRISVINSTGKSGLAAALKKDLEASGYLVKNIGNQSPAQATTVVKSNIDFSLSQPDHLDSIKKIVSQKYDLSSAPLSGDSDYDIEIIIGNR